MSSQQHLEVVLFWGEMPLNYRLLDRPVPITIGPTKRSTLHVPRAPGFPRRFPILRPARGGYRLRVGPGMSGRLRLGGRPRSVQEVLQQPAETGFLRRSSVFREVDVQPGDAGDIYLDGSSGLHVSFEFVAAPQRVPRPRWTDLDPLLARCMGFTALALVLMLVPVLIFGGRADPRTSVVAISPERFARFIEPALKKAEIAREKRGQEGKTKSQEGASAKRARGTAGRMGKQDAPESAELPRAAQDAARAKVAKTGLLGVLGGARVPGSGIGKLLADEPQGDIHQAMTGLRGARVVAGRGSGGLATAGSGTGGGGTGFGRIYGTGDLDVGSGGHGRGRSGPGFGARGERSVSVGLDSGSADTGGALTKEQVGRVVRAHAAAIKYCYEKELQRAPSLAGKIEIFWVIQPSGAVSRTRVAASTMRSASVEGCIERQVKQWQFPKSEGQTIVQSYPFLFRATL